MAVKVNPRIEPCAYAREVAAEIAENGGSLTAEEWEHSQHYESFGSMSSRTRAIEAVKRRGRHGCIVGSAGGWRLYVLRLDCGHNHAEGTA